MLDRYSRKRFLSTCLRPLGVLVLLAIGLQGCDSKTPRGGINAAVTVTELADRFYAMTLELTPELAYSAGIALDRNDGIEDISPQAQQASNAAIDGMLQRLESVDPDLLTGRAEWITHAYLLQHRRDSVATRIVPALRRYRDFLANTYILSAREELSITANPNGRECYEASVRAYTTLDRSAKEIFELGKKTVAANKATVVELGVAAYGSDNFRDIIRKAKADPADRFATKEELLEYARAAVVRAEEEMPNWVGRMPQQTVTDMLDRIAMLPGQQTAYDSGGLEILVLRREAESALGDNFDIREFHDRILENGTIPLLVQLRTHIEVWLAMSESH